MSDVIRPLAYADASLETGTCVGPRYTRNTYSREHKGVLLDEITDKYVGEFNLPFMNVSRYIKEVNNNWSKLNQEQKNMILKSLDKMKLDREDDFTNTSDDNVSDPSGTTTAFLNYLQSNPIALNSFLNSLKADPVLNPILQNYIASNSMSAMGILMIVCLILFIVGILFYLFL